MPSINEAFPSKYLSAADLQGRPVRVTINEVVMEVVGQGAQASNKPILYFAGKQKGLVLNKTNARTIASQCGDEMNDWVGTEIELFSIWTEFNKQQVEAVRVRFPTRAGAAPVRQHPATAAQAPAGGYNERNPPPVDDDVGF